MDKSRRLFSESAVYSVHIHSWWYTYICKWTNQHCGVENRMFLIL